MDNSLINFVWIISYRPIDYILQSSCRIKGIIILFFLISASDDSDESELSSGEQASSGESTEPQVNPDAVPLKQESPPLSDDSSIFSDNDDMVVRQRAEHSDRDVESSDKLSKPVPGDLTPKRASLDREKLTKIRSMSSLSSLSQVRWFGRNRGYILFHLFLIQRQILMIIC